MGFAAKQYRTVLGNQLAQYGEFVLALSLRFFRARVSIWGVFDGGGDDDDDESTQQLCLDGRRWGEGLVSASAFWGEEDGKSLEIRTRGCNMFHFHRPDQQSSVAVSDFSNALPVDCKC